MKSAKLKRLVRDLLPPLVVRALRPKITEPAPQEPAVPEYGYFGDYVSYASAMADSTGYDTRAIGEAVAARMSHTALSQTTDMDERLIEVLAAFAIAIDRIGKDKIKVLDFGGANGLHYEIYRRMLTRIEFDWTVVETPSMVMACRGLLPISWVTEVPSTDFDIVLCGGTLQVLPEPNATLQKLAKKAPWLILQKVPLGDRDRLTVQKVPPHLHGGSYPYWFFSSSRFEAALSEIGSIELAWTVEKERESYPSIGALSRGFLVHSAIHQGPSAEPL